MLYRKIRGLHSSPGIYGKITDITNGNIIGKVRKIKKLNGGNKSGGGGHTPVPPTPTIKDYLCITALEDGCRVYFVMLFSQGSGTTHSTIEYSTDGINWQETESKDIIQEEDESGNPIIKFVAFTEINKGEHVYLKGLNKAYANVDSNIIQFFYCMPSSNEDIVLYEEAHPLEAHPLYNISGNIMSLIYGDDFENKTELTEENKGCFAYMFGFYYLPNIYLNSSKNLKLPATTLSEFCYYATFSSCVALIDSPELPATTLALYCYAGMFYNCTSLTTAPVLPATTLLPNCYNSMFNGCTALTTAPELPATTLADSCYDDMFEGCTSLTTAPVLPATTLADNCYQYMFEGCTSLTTAPVLPATTLADNCYQRMFYSCTNLNYIKCLATDISASNCTDNWVSGVSQTGTFVRNPENTNWSSGNNGIPRGWAIIPKPEIVAGVIFTANRANSTIKLGTASSPYQIRLQDYEYSENGGAGWIKFDRTTTINLNKVGDTVAIRGTLKPSTSDISYIIQISGDVSASGNVNSLWNYTNLDAELPPYCGYSLFFGSSGLTNVTGLTLPATTLSDHCYDRMFFGCGFTTPPSLPATTLADSCYSQMFYGCTSLTTAPALPATTLTEDCYQSMFSRCTSLTSAPELPATTLANYCYWYMFQGCTSLTTAQTILPATTLIYYCYSNMFQGCTSLTTAPTLPATTLEYACYRYMFSGCTNLNYIKCLATDISATYCTTDWVSGVASTGTFVKDPSMTSWTTGVNGIPTNWVVEGGIPAVKFTAKQRFSSIGLNKLSTNQILEYSKDGNTWSSMTTATRIMLNNIGDNVYIKGILSSNNDESNYTQFTMTGNISIKGNINYLWNKNNPDAELKQYCGYSLFSGCTSLSDVSELTLPATTLANACYYDMFNNCTSLTSTPKLPATTLRWACYMEMFENCTSLTTAPELPATTLTQWCYTSMFEGCTSLTTSPVLSATTLVSGCYQNMFKGCTSLTTAQKILPATTLMVSCYAGMFKDCTSLTTAPELPSTTLEIACYAYMFSGCTNLNYIKCLATDISATDCTASWVSGVSQTGTFVKDASMTGWTTGNNGIQTGWTVEDAS